MQQIFRTRIEILLRFGLAALLAFLGFLASRIIISGYIELFLFLLFIAAIEILYFKYYEIFILLILIINTELFFLFPRQLVGRGNYQDLLYLILPLTGIWYFLRRSDRRGRNFNVFVILFLCLILMAILNSHAQGQPIILGLKAAKGYYLILFYFVFMGREINQQRLFKLIVISGVVLAFLNNIQYFFYGNVEIFHIPREQLSLERSGQIRLLVGEFFTIFSPLVALSEYLMRKKITYLIAFLYMLGTVIFQGKTRAVIWGFLVTIFLLLYFSRIINIPKLALIAVPILALIIWFLPLLKTTFLGDIYEITKYELSEKAGNVGIRFEAYNYYFGELAKSPLIGRGIWNADFKEGNPEHVQERGIFLSDIGIAGYLFHFGLIGAIWLIALLYLIYRYAFQDMRELEVKMPYGIIGYFLFSIVTMATLNCLLDRFTIIYLALAFALLSQIDHRSELVS